MIEQIADISFYKELYEIESVRKNRIDNSVQFPTTILTLLVGAFYYILTSDELEILKSENLLYKVSMIIIIPLFVATLVLTIIFLLIMFHNIKNKYNYLPSPENLKDRQFLLFNHFVENHPELKKKERKQKGINYSKKVFQKELIEYYIDCAENNQKTNDKRLKDYYYTRSLIMISIIALTLMVSIILIQNI